MAARALAFITVLVAVAVAGPARAQEKEPDAQARSRTLYDEGSRAYRSGDYPKAIELFLAAYDLSHAPAILFNVAQAYRLAGTCDRALEYYRRSLEEEPDAENRPEVEERIAEMKKCSEAQREVEPQPAAEPEPEAVSAPPAALTATADEPERRPARRTLLPLVTAGAGAAAAVAGGVLYLQARAKFDQVEETCPCEPDSFSGWETATDASYVLMGAGVVVAGAGLLWWWRESHRAPAGVALVPSRRGIGWAASF